MVNCVGLDELALFDEIVISNVIGCVNVCERIHILTEEG